MKKQIMIACFALGSLLANAQFKVYSSGKTYFGGTSTTPLSTLSVGGAGNSQYKGFFYSTTSVNGDQVLRAEFGAPTVGGNYYTLVGTIPSGGANTYGVLGSSYNASPQSTGVAIGVYGYAGNALTGFNYGVYGYILGNNNGSGVFGTTSGNTYIPGKYAGYFYGDIRTTDDSPEKPSGGSWVTASDQRIKKDISNFVDGLNVIRKIRPVNYKYNGIGGYSPEKESIGIIAQEVQQVAPYCIGKTKILIKNSEKSSFSSSIVGSSIKDTTTGEEKYVAEILNYNQDGLFYAMINSIKELDSEVTDLKEQLKSAKGQRGADASGEQGKTPPIHELELANNTVLFQNFPNPFGDGTTIKYFIPDNTSNAQIIFLDEFGSRLKEFKVEEKGMGQLNISTQNLSSGVYSYSLIVNGNVIDTKKMLKSR